MPSEKKLRKEAWENYGAWQKKTKDQFDIDMSYARAKMAAGGLKMTPGMLSAAQTPIQERFDEQMEVYKDTEAYKILKKNWKSQRGKAQTEFASQDLEINTRQKDMFNKEALMNATPEGTSQRTTAETNYNTAKDLYDEGVAFKEETQGTREIYGSLESYYTALYDDKSDMGVRKLSGELLDFNPQAPRVESEGRDDPYDPWNRDDAVGPTYEPIQADYDRPR